ncbi:MAG: HAD family phosphatase [Anaerovoracaceae bacterium]
MLEIKGAIFDLDGTLVDSMYAWETVGSDYLKSIGKVPEEGFDEKIMAMSIADSIEYMRTNYGVVGTDEEVVAGLNNMIGHLYKTEIKTKPGIKAILDFMEKKGIAKTVATANDRQMVEDTLEHNNISKYFKSIYTCNEVKKGKEFPDIYEIAMADLGTDKDSTVVFEDGIHAMRTCAKHDFRIIGMVEDNNKIHIEEMKEICEFLVKNEEDLLDLIKEQA